MNVIPAIDLRHGKVVQLVGGDPDAVAVEAERTPLEQATAWREAGATRLHVVDLDAALGGDRQWHHVTRILQAGLPVQFGGGVRSMLDVQKLLQSGVQQVIVGTQGVQNPAWVRELAVLWPDRVVLAVDARGRDVQVKGWTEGTGIDAVDLVRSLDGSGLGGFLYTDVSREGRLEGIETSVVRELRDAAPDTRLIVSGGVTDMDDLQMLADLGVDAVVLGMSVYTGRIDLAEAVRRFEAPSETAGSEVRA